MARATLRDRRGVRADPHHRALRRAAAPRVLPPAAPPVNFLTPWALLLGVAAAVPLLLHLLRRRSGERVEFPALRYLLRAEREHAREVRLRNLLLLLVRIAMVLALAAALARPIGPLPGLGHPPTAVAIVLDNSASTVAVVGGTTLLEQEKRAARALLASARDADRITLVTFDGAVRSGSPEALG